MYTNRKYALVKLKEKKPLNSTLICEHFSFGFCIFRTMHSLRTRVNDSYSCIYLSIISMSYLSVITLSAFVGTKSFHWTNIICVHGNKFNEQNIIFFCLTYIRNLLWRIREIYLIRTFFFPLSSFYNKLYYFCRLVIEMGYTVISCNEKWPIYLYFPNIAVVSCLFCERRQIR